MFGDGYPGSQGPAAEPTPEDLAAFGEGTLTQQSPPFCPIASRVEPAPRVAFRWPDFLLTAGGVRPGPNSYRTLKVIEYAQPGAQSYEVVLDERCSFAFSPIAQPAGTVGLFPAEQPSGLFRLRVTSGNLDVGRLHDGRSTLVVTGSQVRVELQVMAAAVDIDTVPLPAAPAGFVDNITFAQATVRLNAVPARSRLPSEWRICDWMSQEGVGPFAPIALAPGAAEIQATGMLGTLGTVANLALGNSPFGGGPLVVVASQFNDLVWTPTGCASHWSVVNTPALPPAELFAVSQRGWI